MRVLHAIVAVEISVHIMRTRAHVCIVMKAPKASSTVLWWGLPESSGAASSAGIPSAWGLPTRRLLEGVLASRAALMIRRSIRALRYSRM